jgi:hypothetical protein
MSALLRLFLYNTLKISLVFCIFGCSSDKTSNEKKAEIYEVFAVEGIQELLPGDIIVRPNLGFLPGSSVVQHGSGFGHAALVIKGFKHPDIDSLIAGAIIVESIAKDVSQEFQVRQIQALKRHRMDAFNNTNFDQRYAGNRYRLRLPLTTNQLEKLIAFANQQKGDRSAWNACKRFPDDPFADSLAREGFRLSWADNSMWYCSLLVWQSVLYATGLDIDVNGGYMVYPNDLINSPLFDNKEGHTGRARF